MITKRWYVARRRLGGDEELSLLVLVGAAILVVVVPFAIFRFIQGNVVVGVIDTALVVISSAAVLYAWNTGRTEVPSIVLATILALTVIALANTLGLDGAMWVFPIVLFVFYLVSPLVALALMFGTFVALIGHELLMPGTLFSSILQMVSFFSAFFTAAVFSFAFAVRANRRREDLRRLAIRDPLTGLYNRRHLDEELSIALADRDRYSTVYGLLIFDVDHFKEVNDRQGHVTGDRVLVELATIIRTTIRANDRAFRYGGDEFVILCPGTDASGLRRVAENLVKQTTRRVRLNGTGITISIGGAVLGDGDDKESWNIRADRRLYEAKERGRNTAVVGE
ncbi:MAG: GGDEF domain-containing protein [Alkalispirochaeta sp.]